MLQNPYSGFQIREWFNLHCLNFQNIRNFDKFVLKFRVVDMSNKAKRNLFLTLLILEVVAYILVVMFSSQISQYAKWWIYIGSALLFVFLIGGYRNFSQAVKEDEKYGSM